MFFEAPPRCRRGAGVGVSRRVKRAGGGGGLGARGLVEWGQTQQHNKLKEKFVFLGRRRSLSLCDIHRHVAAKLAGNWMCKSLILRRRLFKWDSTRVQPPRLIPGCLQCEILFSLTSVYIVLYIYFGRDGGAEY